MKKIDADRGLLKSFKPGEVQHVLSDTAYHGDETRQEIKKLKAKACVKPSKSRKTKKHDDKRRDKNRN